MRRHALTDEQWARLEPVLPKPKRGPQGKRGERLFIDAVLYRAKTGIPWRDLPERFGPWKSVYNRFSNWARKGHWETIFRLLQYEVDDVGSIVDGSVVRAHQVRPVEKGVPMQCSGPFSRRFFNQTSRRRRYESPPHPHRGHARAKARNDRCPRAS